MSRMTTRPGLLARALVFVVTVVLLAACGHSRVVKREGSRGSAPTSRTATQAAPRSGEYLVRTGDTLYGIAFRHGLDYREVAGWNRIPAPYLIYPGQRLSLRNRSTASRPGPGTAAVAALPVPRTGSAGAPSAGPSPQPSGTHFVTVSPTPSGATVPTVAAAGSATTVVPATAGTPIPAGAAPLPTVPAASTPATLPTAPMPQPSSAVSASGWRWPTQGPLIGRFLAGDPKRQGLDIAGTAGQPVVAASDGVVVYSGAGLVGYGELIIIKHSDEWLSAYAHNRRRLVAEGTAVKAGQTIAELGRSGTSRDMLHFEVRRNGKPIDPLIVLPAP